MSSKYIETTLFMLLGVSIIFDSQAEVIINRPIVETPKTLSEQIGDDSGFTLSAAFDSYLRRDYESAYNEFNFFVRKNDSKALMANAYLLSSGYVPRDFNKSSEYLSIAASLKYARAVYLQALLEKYKQGTVKFNSTSERLLNQAASMGDYVAANALANYHFEKGNYALAQRWNEKAIELGSAAARKNQSIISNRSESATTSTSSTIVSASNQDLISGLRVRSQSGDANASYDLAVRYHKGAGVAVNFGEAIRLYQLAAKQGSAEARKVLPILISKRTTGGNLNSMWMQEMSNMLPNPIVVNSNSSHSDTVRHELPTNPSHEYLDPEKGGAAIHILEEDDPLDGLLRLVPNR